MANVNNRETAPENPSKPPNWREALQALIGAYALNTIRAIEMDFRRFERWAAKTGVSSLPAEPEDIRQFIQDSLFDIVPRSIDRCVSSIGRIHQLVDLPDPSKHSSIKLELRRMYRLRGRREEQALGLTRDLRDQLLKTCGDDYFGLRDRAVISVGYDTLCRRAEIIKLRTADIRQSGDGSGAILVRKAKNDIFGDGRLAFLSPVTLEAIEAYHRWQECPLRYVVGRYSPAAKRDVPIEVTTVGRIIKRRARRANLPKETVEGLSGHSMRVGAAQDMAAAGLDLAAIMQAGGWKSADIVMRYIENLDVMRSGMAQLYRQSAGESHGGPSLT